MKEEYMTLLRERKILEEGFEIGLRTGIDGLCRILKSLKVGKETAKMNLIEQYEDELTE